MNITCGLTKWACSSVHGGHPNQKLGKKVARKRAKMSEKRRVKKKAASSVPTVVPASPLTDSPIVSFASPVAPPTLPTFGMINPISSLGVIDSFLCKALVGKGGDIFKNISLAKELMANDVVVGTFNTHSWEGIDIPTEDIFTIHTSLERMTLAGPVLVNMKGRCFTNYQGCD